MVQSSEYEAIKQETMAQFYRDVIELEGDKMGTEQKNQFEMKAKAADEGSAFNRKFIQYIKPLL